MCQSLIRGKLEYGCLAFKDVPKSNINNKHLKIQQYAYVSKFCPLLVYNFVYSQFCMKYSVFSTSIRTKIFTSPLPNCISHLVFDGCPFN